MSHGIGWSEKRKQRLGIQGGRGKRPRKKSFKTKSEFLPLLRSGAS